MFKGEISMSVKYPLFAEQVVNRFKLKRLINSDKLQTSEIKLPIISRCDFELTGSLIYKEFWCTSYFGNKESTYLNNFSKEEITKKIKIILDMNPPLVIVGPKFDYKNLILELAKDTNIPIVESDMTYQLLNITVGNWLQECLSEYTLYHGSLLSVYGIGVLITGESGIGKSEVTIELVKKGHIFVADDAVLITRIGPKLFGKPDDKTKNFIEIRGLGILNFAKTFGIANQIPRTRIKVVCELINTSNPKNTNIKIERLGNKINYINIEGVDIPYYKIIVSPGRNISDIIETAIIDLKLKKQGYNPAEDIITQIKEESKKYK